MNAGGLHLNFFIVMRKLLFCKTRVNKYNYLFIKVKILSFIEIYS